MVIYEVNVSVAEGVAGAYEAWLREHVVEMIGFAGFERAEIYVPEGEEVGRRQWTVHYHVRTRAHLEDYLTLHADRMRREGTSRFGEHLAATRRILSRAQIDSTLTRNAARRVNG